MLVMSESHSCVVNNQLFALEMTEAPPASNIRPQIKLVSRRRYRIALKFAEITAVEIRSHSSVNVAR